MFNRKKCGNCENTISKKYEFCPYCGSSTTENSEKREDLGMLGGNDFMNEFDRFSKSIFGGVGRSMINKMLGSAMKMLEKEMQKEVNKKDNLQPKSNFQLFINGKKINLGNSNNVSPQFKEQEVQKRIKELLIGQLNFTPTQ